MASAGLPADVCCFWGSMLCLAAGLLLVPSAVKSITGVSMASMVTFKKVYVNETMFQAFVDLCPVVG